MSATHDFLRDAYGRATHALVSEAKRASSATVSAVNEIGQRTRHALERSGVNGDALEALLRRRSAEAVRARGDARGLERPRARTRENATKTMND